MNKSFIQRFTANIDWVMFLSILPIIGAGLVAMNSFSGENAYFEKQVIWVVVSLAIFFILSNIDFRFFRKTEAVTFIFIVTCGILLLLLGVGTVAKGAKSWFDFGGFSFQPSDPAKIVLIILLAKIIVLSMG
jgi:cell division protein FtsW (lipid II flippase)